MKNNKPSSNLALSSKPKTVLQSILDGEKITDIAKTRNKAPISVLKKACKEARKIATLYHLNLGPMMNKRDLLKNAKQLYPRLSILNFKTIFSTLSTKTFNAVGNMPLVRSK